MTPVASVSDRLGEYMLKGWVLTDQSCPTLGCSVPMMRSPSGRTPITHFCVNCDKDPSGIIQSHPTISISDSSSSPESDYHISRSSTPPTDVSSALSSPVFAPPVDTEESRRRREQSDRASSEIGKRLLKGWAMLGDECPNTRCHGVPLVRPPKAGGEKDPRKECVICGGVYITKVDWAGRERLIPADLGSLKPEISGTASAPTSGRGGKQTETPHQAPVDILPLQEPQPKISNLSNAFAHAKTPQPDAHLARSNSALLSLEESSNTLQSTLHALSTRLTMLSSGHATMDTQSIGLTADAIGKVTQALSHVRQLQWSEDQVQRL